MDTWDSGERYSFVVWTPENFNTRGVPYQPSEIGWRLISGMMSTVSRSCTPTLLSCECSLLIYRSTMFESYGWGAEGLLGTSSWFHLLFLSKVDSNVWRNNELTRAWEWGEVRYNKEEIGVVKLSTIVTSCCPGQFWMPVATWVRLNKLTDQNKHKCWIVLLNIMTRANAILPIALIAILLVKCCAEYRIHNTKCDMLYRFEKESAENE